MTAKPALVTDTPAKPARRSKLLAVSPETVEPQRPKVMIFGPPGCGKTWASLSWPSVFYVDTENGADLGHYRERLKSAGGVYFGPDQGSLDFEAVIGQVEALSTETHPYRTIVIDSISKLFNSAIGDEQNRLGEKDAFGASKKAPIRQMGRLIRWLGRCDMNVIMIAHQRDEWGMVNGMREVVGQTADAWEKLSYELHLVLRISKIGAGDKAVRFANIGKSRLPSFPEGTRFDWNYEEFSSRWGRDVIEKNAKAISLATPDQIEEVKKLLDVIKIPEPTLEKWFKAAECDSFEEMETSKVAGCIKFLRDKAAQ